MCAICSGSRVTVSARDSRMRAFCGIKLSAIRKPALASLLPRKVRPLPARVLWSLLIAGNLWFLDLELVRPVAELGLAGAVAACVVLTMLSGSLARSTGPRLALAAVSPVSPVSPVRLVRGTSRSRYGLGS